MLASGGDAVEVRLRPSGAEDGSTAPVTGSSDQVGLYVVAAQRLALTGAGGSGVPPKTIDSIRGL